MAFSPPSFVFRRQLHPFSSPEQTPPKSPKVRPTTQDCPSANTVSYQRITVSKKISLRTPDLARSDQSSLVPLRAFSSTPVSNPSFSTPIGSSPIPPHLHPNLRSSSHPFPSKQMLTNLQEPSLLPVHYLSPGSFNLGNGVTAWHCPAAGPAGLYLEMKRRGNHWMERSEVG